MRDAIPETHFHPIILLPIYTHYVSPQHYEHIGAYVIRGDFSDNTNKINASVYFMWQ